MIQNKSGQIIDHKTVFRPEQAANYLGLSKNTLAKMRCSGKGPQFLKMGSRAIGYLKDDLNEFIMQSRRQSTSDQGAE